ncbi:MAG: glycoside hydrolase family 88 protein [Defluviitaleaceae bacterium]|nr:glycoside hydrolase family 88 protein [Defluviitaleaceae bacterium]MCL2836316.1 glycoside hydrolase family 88 protein [Defluviitaleaceae bacterium]
MLNFLPEDDRQWVRQTYYKIQEKMQIQCRRIGDMIPFIPRDGRYKDLDTPTGIFWWTNGFWSGILWQMHHATGEGCYRTAAEGVEKRMDDALAGFMGLHHDVGFQWLHTAVANYRLTGNEQSKARGLHAATLLAGRYNPAGKFIRAWNKDMTGWMIIDCMMNLPILYWAGKELGDPRFAYIAESHADTVIAYGVRPDGSCNHISIMDPITGECLENPAGQGYESGSSWSRGQAWALYGFALSYLHSGERRYLDIAKRIAHYFIANLAMNDWLPPADFRAPSEPVKHDTTAAMCACCGMLEITKHVGEHEKALYFRAALNTLKACVDAFCDWDSNRDGIMGQGTSQYHGKEDQLHVPIIYGDYFFVEAILRLLEKDFLIW